MQEVNGEIMEAASPGIFITGTDTGVGKTVVTAALATCLKNKGLDVNIIKPFQTGTECGGIMDAEFVHRVAGLEYDQRTASPIELKKPLSPYAASRIESVEIKLQPVIEQVKSSIGKNEVTLVEGAGGLAVPIMEDFYMSDLAADIGLPLLIVTRPGLGTLNHTTLTVEYARSRGLRILGIVVSDFPEKPDLAQKTNLPLLIKMTGCEIVGIIPSIEPLDVERGIYGDLAEKCESYFIEKLGGTLKIDNYLT